MEKSFKNEMELFYLDPEADETYQLSRKLWLVAKATCVQGALVHCVMELKDKLQIRKACKLALEDVKKWTLPLPAALRARAMKGVFLDL